VHYSNSLRVPLPVTAGEIPSQRLTAQLKNSALSTSTAGLAPELQAKEIGSPSTTAMLTYAALPGAAVAFWRQKDHECGEPAWLDEPVMAANHSRFGE
jgi:hypothetical protein